MATNKDFLVKNGLAVTGGATFGNTISVGKVQITTSGIVANGVIINANTVGGNTAADLIGYTNDKAANAYSNAASYADTKVSKSGDTISGDLTVTGNLTIQGTTVTVSANNLTLEDNMIYLNDGLQTNAHPDLGIAGSYNDGTYHHAGIFRDASDGIWKVYDNYEPEPDASPWIDTSNATFHIADFQANTIVAASFNVGTTPVINTSGYFVGSIVSGNSSTAGILQVVDSVTNTSTTIAASANSVKAAYDIAATAYSNAVSVAATDASSKAATAYSNAIAYAANASNISSGKLNVARLGALGVANSTNVLYGSDVWAPIQTSMAALSDSFASTAANNQVLQYQISKSGGYWMPIDIPSYAAGELTITKLVANTVQANGTIGTAGQALLSNGTGIYWGAASGPAGPTGPTGPTGPAGPTGPTGPTGGGVSSVGLTASNTFVVTNSPITSSGNLNIAFANTTALGQIFAGPSGTTGQPLFRTVNLAEIGNAYSYNLLDMGGTFGATDGQSLKYAVGKGGGAWIASTLAPSDVALGTTNDVQFASVGVGTAASGVAGTLKTANNINCLGNIYTGSTGYNGTLYASSVYLSDYQLAVEAGDLFISGELLVRANTSTQAASLGVGTNASGTAGEIRATNNITAYYSDERLKTKLGNIENAVEMVGKLSGFYYEANEVAQALGYDVKREVGVSAQEVQAIMPEIVAPAPIDDKYLTVRYERLVPLLIEAIKELKAEIDQLKAK